MGFLKAVLLALGLVFFGFFGFLVGLVLLLLSPIIPGARYWANSFFLKPFGFFARTLVGIRLEVLNPERIHSARPAIFIGNHQSGLDLAIIGSTCPARSVIVGKKEIKSIPVFGWFFWIAGNLLIDRADKANAKGQIEKVRQELGKNQLNLAIFPEGTRSKTGEILPFKRGAFYLAASTGYPIIPVVCSNLKGKAIWERFELSGGKVVISVMPPIETQGIPFSELMQFSEQVRGAMIQEYDRVTVLAKESELR
jgi:1-acyl-sn-glycerol-3-phosphate acyltransferase